VASGKPQALFLKPKQNSKLVIVYTFSQKFVRAFCFWGRIAHTYYKSASSQQKPCQRHIRRAGLRTWFFGFRITACSGSMPGVLHRRNTVCVCVCTCVYCLDDNGDDDGVLRCGRQVFGSVARGKYLLAKFNGLSCKNASCNGNDFRESHCQILRNNAIDERIESAIQF